MFYLDEKYRERLNQWLLSKENIYDEQWKGLRSHLGKANYHTQLAMCDVHGTRDALNYALALLDSREEMNCRRACNIIRNMISLQDSDPMSKTFGIWSWYMEEPLTQMNPPDFNWADFCGKTMLFCYRFHRDILPQSLQGEMKSCIRNTCLSIFRRNVTPLYTNIAIMGAFVTLLAGETFGWEDMVEYGRSRIEKQCELLKENGAMPEYNSPTYTLVVMEDLTQFKAMIRDTRALEAAEQILDLAWKTVAEHYHVSTGPWVGPNARSYAWLNKSDIPGLLAEALHDPSFCREGYFTPSWIHVAWDCPEKYRHFFYENRVREVKTTFREATGEFLGRQLTARTYMTPAFALSSFSGQDTWNQRRDLLGFWGGKKTRFIGASILHDRYDFSSGLLTIDQKGGEALIGASFFLGGGDTHCNLDMVENHTITAWDLRLRLEIGGELEHEPVIQDGHIFLKDGGICLKIELVGAAFDGITPALCLEKSEEDMALLREHGSLYRRYEEHEKRWFADVVFRAGEKKIIRLDSLEDAWAVLKLSIREDDGTDDKKTMNLKVLDSEVIAEEKDTDGLKIVLSRKPERRKS